MSELVGKASVSLRALDLQDAASIAAACRAAPDIVHWVVRVEGLNEADGRDWIEERQQKERERAQITRAVIDLETEKLVGMAWLGPFDHEARRAEVAYWTRRRCAQKKISRRDQCG